jgi:5'-3' exonuclease
MNHQDLMEAYDRIGLGLESDLLIDGRNCCYRAIYANRGDSDGPQYHSLVVMLRFMHSWLELFRPRNVHVFWDAPKATLWRRRILPTYKERDTQYTLDIGAELEAMQDAAQAIFKNLNIHQYLRKGQEADDLIYALCRIVTNRPLVIISSDGDFTQLMHQFRNALLFEPRKNELVACPQVDPVVQKSLMGDKTDKVDGYDGIGPVKSTKLAASLSDRLDFLGQVGRMLYIRNRMLIDMSLCPYVLANIMYVERVLCEDLHYDKAEVIKLSRSFKVHGLFQEYERVCSPYKTIGGGHDDRYACPDCGGPQRRSPHGWSCPNGHGYGEPTIKVTVPAGTKTPA